MDYLITKVVAATTTTTIDVDEVSIRVNRPFDSLCIEWQQITRIETNGTAFSIQSANQQMGISMLMADKGRIHFVRFLEAYLENSDIDVVFSQSPPVKHKNVRVRK